MFGNLIYLCYLCQVKLIQYKLKTLYVMKTSKVDTLKELLFNLSISIPELKDKFFELSDSRLGKKIALAEKVKDSSGINIITDYMDYDCMKYFLYGYSRKAENPIK